MNCPSSLLSLAINICPTYRTMSRWVPAGGGSGRTNMRSGQWPKARSVPSFHGRSRRWSKKKKPTPGRNLAYYKPIALSITYLVVTVKASKLICLLTRGPFMYRYPPLDMQRAPTISSHPAIHPSIHPSLPLLRRDPRPTMNPYLF